MDANLRWSWSCGFARLSGACSEKASEEDHWAQSSSRQPGWGGVNWKVIQHKYLMGQQPWNKYKYMYIVYILTNLSYSKFKHEASKKIMSKIQHISILRIGRYFAYGCPCCWGQWPRGLISRWSLPPSHMNQFCSFLWIDLKNFDSSGWLIGLHFSVDPRQGASLPFRSSQHAINSSFCQQGDQGPSPQEQRP